MTSWTCPNTKCTYDMPPQSGQQCPLCREQAAVFNFSEFGNLLKQKGDLKSIEGSKKKETASHACIKNGFNSPFRLEKNGVYDENKPRFEAQNCHKTQKRNRNHFTPICHEKLFCPTQTDP